MKIVTKGVIKVECWNLDYELIKWLNEHLKVYLKECKNIVNLEYCKFKYKKKEYTQEDIIKRLIDITEILLDVYWEEKHSSKEMEAYKNEMYDLLKLVHWYLWW